MSENTDFVIKVNGVSKDYGKAHVLDNMTFSVPKGSIFGLVGRNGAGKTTIMRIMSGLQKPTSGTVEYGFDHKKLGNIGALVELPSIYSNASARDNLIYQYINLGLKIDETIDENLAFVGLGDTGKKKAGKFSLGMRQRLGIAMAMAGNPELLNTIALCQSLQDILIDVEHLFRIHDVGSGILHTFFIQFSNLERTLEQIGELPHQRLLQLRQGTLLESVLPFYHPDKHAPLLQRTAGLCQRDVPLVIPGGLRLHDPRLTLAVQQEYTRHRP